MGKINLQKMIEIVEQVRDVLLCYDLDDFQITLEQSEEVSSKDDGITYKIMEKEHLGLGILLVKNELISYKGSFEVTGNEIKDLVNQALREVSCAPIRQRLNGLSLLNQMNQKEQNSLYRLSTTLYKLRKKRCSVILNKKNELIMDQRLYGSLASEWITQERQLERSIGWSGKQQSCDSLIEQLDYEVQQLADKYIGGSTVTPGVFPVVFDALAAGMLFHEIIHFFEADHFNLVSQQPYLKTDLNLNILDDPSQEGYFGSQVYDDEGTKTEPYYLVKDGKWQGNLTAKYYPHIVGKSNGHARSQDIRFMPKPRMNNIFVTKGQCTNDHLIADVKKGFYITRISAGYANKKKGEIVLKAEEAYMIENGRITSPMLPFIFKAHLTEIWCHISALGKDQKTVSLYCKCKSGDVPVSLTQPSIRVDHMTIVKGVNS